MVKLDSGDNHANIVKLSKTNSSNSTLNNKTHSLKANARGSVGEQGVVNKTALALKSHLTSLTRWRPVIRQQSIGSLLLAYGP
jgi:hypothetical protein